MKRRYSIAFIVSNTEEYRLLRQNVGLEGNEEPDATPAPVKEIIDNVRENRAKATQRARFCQCNPYSNFTKVGPFVLGARINDTQFYELEHYLGRKVDDTDPNRHYFLKIVVLPMVASKENHLQRQAKLMIYNEYNVLKLLQGVNGVIPCEGLYMDYFYEPVSSSSSSSSSSASSPQETEDSSNNPTKDGEDDEVDDTKCEQCLRWIKANLGKCTRITSELEPGTSLLASSSSSSSSSSPCDVNPNDSSNPPLSYSDEQHFLKCSYPHQNGRFRRRIILAFEYLTPHMFRSPVLNFENNFNRYPRMKAKYETLQEYVKRYKNIPELKTLQIFSEVVNVIYDLHVKYDVAHRDLRLENILYNPQTGKIILVNFGLSRYVINDQTCISDHRGSSAYISPDVLKRRPYNPKASDIWSLGIIFYTMLFGKFPFYAENFAELFKKINQGLFTIPNNVLVWRGPSSHQPRSDAQSIVVSEQSENLIRLMIVTDYKKRVKIHDLRDKLREILQIRLQVRESEEREEMLRGARCLNTDLQVVPQLELRRPSTSPLDSISSRAKLPSVEFREPSSSWLFTTMYETIEKSLGRNSSEANVQDEDLCSLYDQNSSPFTAYLESPLSLATPPFLSSTYFSLENRFYSKYDSSAHTSSNHRVNNFKCLLVESGVVQAPPPPPLSDSPINLPHEIPLKRRLRRSTQLYSHARSNRSNFTVEKIEGDIRLPTDHEIRLFNSLVQQTIGHSAATTDHLL